MFEAIPERYTNFMLCQAELDELINTNKNDEFIVKLLTDLKERIKI